MRTRRHDVATRAKARQLCADYRLTHRTKEEARRTGLASGVGLKPDTFTPHPPSVHFPLLITVTSRSFRRQRNETTLPSTHMSVRIVSPG